MRVCVCACVCVTLCARTCVRACQVSPEAREVAEELGVKIFTADIIYHLFDQFTAYMRRVKDDRKAEAAEEAVFPVVLKILPNCVFNKKDPIVLGVEVLEGVARVRGGGDGSCGMKWNEQRSLCNMCIYCTHVMPEVLI